MKRRAKRAVKPTGHRPSSERPRAPSTRARLVDAAIEIVRSSGLGALTTVEITRRVGIAQPGFYKHFRNVDECLEAATTQVLDGMRETFNAMRRGIRDRTDPEEVAGQLLAVLDAVAEDRPFNELVARYRRDPSPLGAAIRDVMTRVKDDFVGELWSEAQAAGLPAKLRPELRLTAELTSAIVEACVHRVLDDPATDREGLARDAAPFLVAGTRASIGRLLARAGVSARPGRRGP